MVSLGSAPATQAQVFASTANVQCVGGIVGCTQADFFLTFLGLGSAIDVDRFTRAVQTPGWLLANLQAGEAHDAFGPLPYDSQLLSNKTGLDGTFIFPSTVSSASPTLRVRIDFTANAFTDASKLAFSYSVYNQNALQITGQLLPQTPVPESASLVLLAVGLASALLLHRGRARGA
jgi:hypothetical protein